jgi:hypothetical protein
MRIAPLDGTLGTGAPPAPREGGGKDANAFRPLRSGDHRRSLVNERPDLTDLFGESGTPLRVLLISAVTGVFQNFSSATDSLIRGRGGD